MGYHSSNTLNYELIPEKIILPAYDTIEAKIRYSPSSVKTIETAELRLSSKILGDWVFKLKGRGIPPTAMEPLEIAAAVGETNSS